MADLPTNLKDDILDSSVNTRRKYRMIENEDGTYSFEDVTEYSQVGDEYGAGLINETNRQVNARVEKAVVVRDLETIGAITQPGFIPDALAVKDVNDSLGGLKFGTDGEGNYGYFGDDDVLVPFSRFINENSQCKYGTITTSATTVKTITLGFRPKFIMFEFSYNGNSDRPMKVFLDCTSLYFARYYYNGNAHEMLPVKVGEGGYFATDGTPVEVTDSGISFKVMAASYAQSTKYYAVG